MLTENQEILLSKLATADQSIRARKADGEKTINFHTVDIEARQVIDRFIMGEQEKFDILVDAIAYGLISDNPAIKQNATDCCNVLTEIYKSDQNKNKDEYVIKDKFGQKAIKQLDAGGSMQEILSIVHRTRKSIEKRGLETPQPSNSYGSKENLQDMKQDSVSKPLVSAPDAPIIPLVTREEAQQINKQSLATMLTQIDSYYKKHKTLNLPVSSQAFLDECPALKEIYNLKEIYKETGSNKQPSELNQMLNSEVHRVLGQAQVLDTVLKWYFKMQSAVLIAYEEYPADTPDITVDFSKYSQLLAKKTFVDKTNVISANPIQIPDIKDKLLQQCFDACPLEQVDGGYQYIHPSLEAYFVTRSDYVDIIGDDASSVSEEAPSSEPLVSAPDAPKIPAVDHNVYDEKPDSLAIRPSMETNEVLFDRIYNLALEGNVEELRSMVDGGIDIDTPKKELTAEYSVACLLASQGKHKAVELLQDQLEANKDKILFGYAIAGNKIKVAEYEKTYKSEYNQEAILRGYALGGHHKLLEEYSKSRSISRNEVAISYADVGDIESVARYVKNMDVDVDKPSDAYIDRGLHKDEKQTQMRRKNIGDKIEITEPKSSEEYFTYRTYKPEKPEPTARKASRYKLRVNLKTDSFKKNSDVVINIINEMVVDSNGKPIYQYKQIKGFGLESLDVAKEYEFWRLMKEGEFEAARSHAYKISRVGPTGSINSNKLYAYHYHYKDFDKIKVDVEMIKTEYQRCSSAYNELKKDFRFEGSAQFTLYINSNSDDNEVAKFAVELNRRLKKAGLTPGKVAESDLAAQDSGSFISIRQESLNSAPDKYIPAKENATILAQLKKELSCSSIYKKITESIKKDELINKLSQYVARIEANKQNDAIDFRSGFWICKNSRALNREANYYLAKKLINKLSAPDVHDVSSIIKKCKEMRAKIIEDRKINEKPDYVEREIGSSELNEIITKGLS